MPRQFEARGNQPLAQLGRGRVEITRWRGFVHPRFAVRQLDTPGDDFRRAALPFRAAQDLRHRGRRQRFSLPQGTFNGCKVGFQLEAPLVQTSLRFGQTEGRQLFGPPPGFVLPQGLFDFKLAQERRTGGTRHEDGIFGSRGRAAPLLLRLQESPQLRKTFVARTFRPQSWRQQQHGQRQQPKATTVAGTGTIGIHALTFRGLRNAATQMQEARRRQQQSEQDEHARIVHRHVDGQAEDFDIGPVEFEVERNRFVDAFRPQLDPVISGGQIASGEVVVEQRFTSGSKIELEDLFRQDRATRRIDQADPEGGTHQRGCAVVPQLHHHRQGFSVQDPRRQLELAGEHQCAAATEYREVQHLFATVARAVGSRHQQGVGAGSVHLERRNNRNTVEQRRGHHQVEIRRREGDQERRLVGTPVGGPGEGDDRRQRVDGEAPLEFGNTAAIVLGVHPQLMRAVGDRHAGEIRLTIEHRVGCGQVRITRRPGGGNRSGHTASFGWSRQGQNGQAVIEPEAAGLVAKIAAGIPCFDVEEIAAFGHDRRAGEVGLLVERGGDRSQIAIDGTEGHRCWRRRTQRFRRADGERRCCRVHREEVAFFGDPAAAVFRLHPQFVGPVGNWRTGNVRHSVEPRFEAHQVGVGGAEGGARRAGHTGVRCRRGDGQDRGFFVDRWQEVDDQRRGRIAGRIAGPEGQAIRRHPRGVGEEVGDPHRVFDRFEDQRQGQRTSIDPVVDRHHLREGVERPHPQRQGGRAGKTVASEPFEGRRRQVDDFEGGRVELLGGPGAVDGREDGHEGLQLPHRGGIRPTADNRHGDREIGWRFQGLHHRAGFGIDDFHPHPAAQKRRVARVRHPCIDGYIATRLGGRGQDRQIAGERRANRSDNEGIRGRFGQHRAGLRHQHRPQIVSAGHCVGWPGPVEAAQIPHRQRADPPLLGRHRGAGRHRFDDQMQDRVLDGRVARIADLGEEIGGLTADIEGAIRGGGEGHRDPRLDAEIGRRPGHLGAVLSRQQHRAISARHHTGTVPAIGKFFRFTTKTFELAQRNLRHFFAGRGFDEETNLSVARQGIRSQAALQHHGFARQVQGFVGDQVRFEPQGFPHRYQLGDAVVEFVGFPQKVGRIEHQAEEEIPGLAGGVERISQSPQLAGRQVDTFEGHHLGVPRRRHANQARFEAEKIGRTVVGVGALHHRGLAAEREGRCRFYRQRFGVAEKRRIDVQLDRFGRKGLAGKGLYGRKGIGSSMQGHVRHHKLPRRLL